LCYQDQADFNLDNDALSKDNENPQKQETTFLPVDHEYKHMLSAIFK
jgi:hypothetical protein